MKLTLWNQFSSNHSANFVMVGEFASAQAAEDAATEMRDFLADLGVWWQAQGREWSFVYEALSASGMTSPIEAQLLAHYNLARPKRLLDWVLSEDANTAVHTMGHRVIVDQSGSDAVGDTWCGPYPFDEILRHKGATVWIGEEAKETTLAVHLTCLAPDEEVAFRIFEETRTHRPNTLKLLELRHCEGELAYEGRRLMFRNVKMLFGHKSLHELLTRLIGYLESHGCKGISYTFTEEPL